MKFRPIQHTMLPTDFEAEDREEAWEILQAWLDSQIELLEVDILNYDEHPLFFECI